MADRVVVMNQGRVEQIGTPDQVYDHPATAFVYGFLGAVNLFHGRVHGQQLQVGVENLTLGQHEFQVGAEALGFVRPHELEIDTDLAQGSGLEARVERVLTLGATTRVDLVGADHAAGRHYEVELPRDRITALGLVVGQRVRLKPARIRLFSPPRPTERTPCAPDGSLVGGYGENI